MQRVPKGTKVTRSRIIGEDTPFGVWMRAHPRLTSMVLVATDVDLWVHCYRTLVDSERTRKLQTLQMIEVKTRNGEPTPSQLDTLMKVNSGIKRTYTVNGQVIRNYGVSFLSMSGTTPDNSDQIRWGRFRKNKLAWTRIDRDSLVSLMLSEMDPHTLEKRLARNHHATKTIIQTEKCPLGFTVMKPVTFKS